MLSRDDVGGFDPDRVRRDLLRLARWERESAKDPAGQLLPRPRDNVRAA